MGFIKFKFSKIKTVNKRTQDADFAVLFSMFRQAEGTKKRVLKIEEFEKPSVQ